MKTDNLIQSLVDWNCDVDGAMARFLDDKELYVKCLETIIDDPAFEDLKKALECKEVKSGFEAAHTLKGVLANLGLTPMFEVVVKIVEPLRAGSSDGLLEYYEELISHREYLKQLMEAE